MTKFTISNRFYIIFTLLFSVLFLPVSEVINELALKANMAGLTDLMELGVIKVPSTVILVGFSLWLYVTHLWKWPIINKIHNIPNLNGRYVGVIKSSYNGGSKHKCTVEIKQTLIKTEISLFTAKSSSWSFIANLVKTEHGNWGLTYVYSNHPRSVSADPDMRIHNGFATLDVLGNGGNLEGRYFNHSRERNTFGELHLKFKSKKYLRHF